MAEIPLEIEIRVEKLEETVKAFEKLAKAGLSSIKGIEQATKNTSASVDQLNQSSKKTEEGFSSLLSASKALISAGLVQIGTTIFEANSAFIASAKSSELLSTGFLSISKQAVKTADSFFSIDKASKTLFDSVGRTANALTSTATKATALGTILLGLGIELTEADAAVLKFAGGLSILASVIVGGFGLALAKLITATGVIIKNIGTTMVNANKDALESFINVDQSVFAFNRTVENTIKIFGSAIGSTDEWNKTIEEIVNTTGQLENSVRFSATEIISATKSIGLNSDQMQTLLKVAADYSAFAKKDLVETTIALINGLNGQSQSVISLGIHLTESAVAQKKFGDAGKRNLSSLTESEKVQARYDKLLSEYSTIAGFAADSTNTLAGASKLLESRLNTLNQEFGRGVAFIESTILADKLLADTLNLIPKPLVTITGAISSLLGRVLQAAGFFIQWSFAISVVTSSIKLLNTFLASSTAIDLFSKNIIFLNKSLIDLIKSSGAATVELTSLSGVFKTLASFTFASLKNGLASFLGLAPSALNLANILRVSLFTSFSLLTTAASTFGRVLSIIALNPFTLKITALVSIFYVLFKALETIENKTGAFSTAFNAVIDSFRETASILDPLIASFGIFKDSLFSIADQAFGAIVFALSNTTKAFVDLLSIVGIFSSDSVAKLKKSSDSLSKLSNNIKDVNFQFSKLENENANRKLASFNKPTEESKELIEELDKLIEKYQNAGKSQIQIINETTNKEIERLNFLAKELPSRRAAIEKTIENVIIDSQKRISDETSKIAKKQLDEAESIAKEKADMELKVAREQRERLRALSSGDVQQIITELQIRTQFSSSDFGALGASLFGAISEGAQGAQKVISGAFGAAADAFIPGAGAAVSKIVDVLSQGPEQVKATVKAFASSIGPTLNAIFASIGPLFVSVFDSLPGIIEGIFGNPNIVLNLIGGINRAVEALVDNIPSVIDALVDNVPVFIQKLLEEAPRIIQRLVDSTPLIVDALAARMPDIAIAFQVAFIQATPKMLEGFAIALRKAVEAVFQTFANGVKEIFKFDEIRVGLQNALKSAFNGIADAINGVLPGSPVKKLATGGKVPSGFNNDTFPARLTSGELVVSKDTTRELELFLARQSQPQGQDSSSMIGQLVEALSGQQASATPSTMTVNLVISDKQLASAILDLNRRGFRLA